jgi:Putative esterase
MRHPLIIRIVSIVLIWFGSAAQAALPRAVTGVLPPDFGYAPFTTSDAHGRTVTLYLTDPGANDDRPLIVVLQGSGCASHFFKRDGQISGGWHSFVRSAAMGRAQVLLVEKPGVQTFDSPAKQGSAEHCSDDFRREHTGPRWLTALRAAIDAAMALRGMRPKAMIAMGHSEGGVYAPRLALIDPRITHVVSLAATPHSQLSDFVHMAMAGEGFISKAPGTRQDHLRRVLHAWQAVQSDPNSMTKMVFGHSHRYWDDKFAPFNYGALANTTARFFVAYGGKDENSSPVAMDQFAVELITRKRDVTWLRVHEGNHSFATPSEARPFAGFMEIVTTAVAWGLGDSVQSPYQVWPLPS